MRTKSCFAEALCLHPKGTIGILVNKNEQRTWYFIDGRSYYIVCPGGFKTQEDGELWLCSDGEWVDGTDCVRKSEFDNNILCKVSFYFQMHNALTITITLEWILNCQSHLPL